MDSSKIVFLINDTVRAISGRYEDGGKTETFKTFDQSIAVDDLVVVQSGTRHGMTVVKVVEIDVDVNYDSTVPMLWVSQRIDGAAFKKILEQEAEAISAVQAAELRRKKAELRKTMFADHEASIAALSLTHRSEDAVTE